MLLRRRTSVTYLVSISLSKKPRAGACSQLSISSILHIAAARCCRSLYTDAAPNQHLPGLALRALPPSPHHVSAARVSTITGERPRRRISKLHEPRSSPPAALFGHDCIL